MGIELNRTRTELQLLLLIFFKEPNYTSDAEKKDVISEPPNTSG